MEPMRRSQYRVELDESLGAQVVVELHGGAVHRGQLLDVSASGAGVRFEGEAPPSLGVGQEVDLVFGGRPFGAPITVAARVQHRTEERNGARRYGFRFLQPQQLDAGLPPALRTYFNRRQVVRVEPSDDEQIPVTMSAGDGPEIEARLQNLSLLGIGLALDTAVEPYLADSPAVKISIGLPGNRRPVELLGVIRHRRLVGGCIHYGIAFDPDATPGFARQQDAISRWVLRRQLEHLRKPA
jgi:c-di-GMP-binding flagellar brake protein YcgR